MVYCLRIRTLVPMQAAHNRHVIAVITCFAPVRRRHRLILRFRRAAARVTPSVRASTTRRSRTRASDFTENRRRSGINDVRTANWTQARWLINLLLKTCPENNAHGLLAVEVGKWRL